MSFLGYPRPDGSYGTRNYVLVLPGGLVSSKICQFVDGVRTIITPDYGGGRTQRDRQTVARVLVGLGRNPNVAGVILHGLHPAMQYPELKPAVLAQQIAASGKPVEVITAQPFRDTYEVLVRGIKAARRLVCEASHVRRQETGDEHLCLGVKCGVSDSTSGIAGNPAVGYLYDQVVAAGGTAMFGETTEIIGAEHLLAQRAASPEVAQRILAVSHDIEEKSKGYGQDIRTVNPIPANIEAGITTLEEKSLGAIAKAGSTPIQGVLAYGERPAGKGLYFVDNWMSMNSIFLGYAASGANLTLMVWGGGGYVADTILYPSLGVVAPLLWTTGNVNTYRACEESMDFCAGTVIDGSETLGQAGDRLLALVRQVASGSFTKTDTLSFQEANKVYFQDAAF
ncbi:MAG: D-galactarate dehydratase [Desulfarculus sp.]|jgi:altronate dehydratase large subunit|nr:MAG: D-galactarate dehydratase [Desulfarculus sp.]